MINVYLIDRMRPAATYRKASGSTFAPSRCR